MAPARKVPADTVGVRDLKASLSGYLRRVRAGESLTVTDHGLPIARLVPAGLPAELERLLGQSWFTWSGRKPALGDPPLRLTRGPSASDTVIRMREEGEAALTGAILGARRSRKRP